MKNSDSITNILNQLYNYSNTYLAVRNDISLPIPGFSTIEQDIHGRLVPTVIMNLTLIPNDDNILAHVLSHEWGHHVSKHLLSHPLHQSQSQSQHQPQPQHQPLPQPLPQHQPQHIGFVNDLQQKENEADLFAAKFITHFKYNKSPIIDFFKKHPIDIQNRINILTNLTI